MRPIPFLLPSLFLGVALASTIATANIDLASASASRDSAPPSPPYVASVPENADWTITITNPPLPPPPPETPPQPDLRATEVHTTKAGALRRNQVTAANSGTPPIEHWTLPNLYFWTTPQGKPIMTDLSSNPPSDGKDADPESPKGFPGVAWVKLELFDQTLTFEKHTCHHYVLPGGALEAWIDTETRLPVAYQQGDTVYLYKFNAFPGGTLTLPASFQGLNEAAQKVIDRRKELMRTIK